MAACVRRTRGDQRGLERDGDILLYRPGETRVMPTFLPPVSINWDVPGWEEHPVTYPRLRRAEMNDWSGKTASKMVNLVALLPRVRQQGAESVTLVFG